MQIKITKSFADVSFPVPFRIGERLNVPDELAETWVTNGVAAKLAPVETATRNRRDTATKIPSRVR